MKKIYLVIVLLLMNGCVALDKQYPDIKYYAYDVAKRIPSEEGAKAVAVKEISISPRFEGNSFVYKKTAFEFQTDFYNRFLVDLSTLIKEQTENYFKIDSLPSHRQEILLSIEVSKVYADFSEQKPKAIMSMHIKGRDSVLKKDVFEIQKTETALLAEASPEAYIDALKTVHERILEDIDAQLAML